MQRLLLGAAGLTLEDLRCLARQEDSRKSLQEIMREASNAPKKGSLRGPALTAYFLVCPACRGMTA